MSYIRRAITNRQWGKLVMLFGLSIVIGILLFYGTSLLFEIGTLEFLLAIILAIFVGNFILAWENERGIELGKVELKNEIVGNIVIADEEFFEYEEGFKGKIRIGTELWTAISKSPISAGAKVKIASRDGLILHVGNCV